MTVMVFNGGWDGDGDYLVVAMLANGCQRCSTDRVAMTPHTPGVTFRADFLPKPGGHKKRKWRDFGKTSSTCFHRRVARGLHHLRVCRENQLGKSSEVEDVLSPVLYGMLSGAIRGRYHKIVATKTYGGGIPPFLMPGLSHSRVTFFHGQKDCMWE